MLQQSLSARITAASILVLGLPVDRDVEIGVFPEGKEILVRLARERRGSKVSSSHALLSPVA